MSVKKEISQKKVDQPTPYTQKTPNKNVDTINPQQKPVTDGDVETQQKPVTDGDVEAQQKPVTDGDVETQQKPVTDGDVEFA